MKQDITTFFRSRDQAVKTKDKKLFLSTQIGEIAGAGSDGYLSVDEMKSEILAVSAGDTPITQAAVVKETYFNSGKKSHSALLIYHLIHTIKGWKIYKISY